MPISLPSCVLGVAATPARRSFMTGDFGGADRILVAGGGGGAGNGGPLLHGGHGGGLEAQPGGQGGGPEGSGLAAVGVSTIRATLRATSSSRTAC
ncbi:hypothetical protein [Streptomyces sp. NPDC041003]|uniref:hypothetical protein n=1 Tax=Streptomyces sp. NPDC041003 TaxID=3155730 RepID=UPI0033DE1AD2